MVAPVYKNANALLFLIVCDVIFCFCLIRNFIFEGALTALRTILGSKSLGLLKKLSKIITSFIN